MQAVGVWGWRVVYHGASLIVGRLKDSRRCVVCDRLYLLKSAKQETYSVPCVTALYTRPTPEQETLRRQAGTLQQRQRVRIHNIRYGSVDDYIEQGLQPGAFIVG